MSIAFTNSVHTKGNTSQNQGRVPGRYSMIEMIMSQKKKNAQCLPVLFFVSDMLVGFEVQI